MYTVVWKGIQYVHCSLERHTVRTLYSGKEYSTYTVVRKGVQYVHCSPEWNIDAASVIFCLDFQSPQSSPLNTPAGDVEIANLLIDI